MGEGQHMPGCPVEAHWLERSWGGEQDRGSPGLKLPLGGD